MTRCVETCRFSTELLGLSFSERTSPLERYKPEFKREEEQGSEQGVSSHVAPMRSDLPRAQAIWRTSASYNMSARLTVSLELLISMFTRYERM